MTTASCHDPKVFDAFLRERFLRVVKKSVAVKTVEKFAEEVSLSDAVLLAIEALSARESKELRRVVDQFHAWCEWRDKWESKGWKCRRRDAKSYIITSPPYLAYTEPPPPPHGELIMAAANASSNEYMSEWNTVERNSMQRREILLRG